MSEYTERDYYPRDDKPSESDLKGEKINPLTLPPSEDDPPFT